MIMLLRLIAVLGIGYLTVAGDLPDVGGVAVPTDMVAALAITLLMFPVLRNLLD